MEKYSSGTCTICTKYFSTLHWHHTIPRSLGGEHSLQIPLCGDCHTTLHANADAVVAKINGGKRITRVFWTRPGDAERAEKWLGILVNTMLFPQDVENKEYLISTKIDTATHNALIQLKQMIGAKNLQDVYLFCIATTLKQRGLYDEQRSTERPKESVSRTQKPKADLW